MLVTLNQGDLCKQFCAAVKLHSRPNGMVMLKTPFSYPDGDQYALYLTETKTGGIRLSDGGTTLIQLSYENDPSKYFDGTRQLTFTQIVAEQGISFDDETSQLYIETTPQELVKSAFQLGQAMTRIYDLIFLNRSRVASAYTKKFLP